MIIVWFPLENSYSEELFAHFFLWEDIIIHRQGVPRFAPVESELEKALRLQTPVAGTPGEKPGLQPMSEAQFQALHDGSIEAMNRRAITATNFPKLFRGWVSKLFLFLLYTLCYLFLYQNRHSSLPFRSFLLASPWRISMWYDVMNPPPFFSTSWMSLV